MLAIAGGGTLYQDLSLSGKEVIQHFQHAKRWETTHAVTISLDSRLYSIFGSDVMTNSYHHMAVKDCPESFRITAMASDGTPEAIEYRDSEHYLVGVQWHPEMMLAGDSTMRPLFESFIEASTPRL